MEVALAFHFTKFPNILRYSIVVSSCSVHNYINTLTEISTLGCCLWPFLWNYFFSVSFNVQDGGRVLVPKRVWSWFAPQKTPGLQGTVTIRHKFSIFWCSLVPRPVRAIRVTRGGLEPSAIARVLGELSRQAWQVTSHPKSPRTTGNEAAFGEWNRA